MRGLPDVQPEEDPLGCIRGFVGGCMVEFIIVALLAIAYLIWLD